MTSAKNVYEVRVEFVYYAVANSEDEAGALAKEASSNEIDYADIHAVKVTEHQPLCWPGNCLLYGTTDDLTLDRALLEAGLPTAAEIKAAWAAKHPSKQS
jgi:hypothetical protein